MIPGSYEPERDSLFLELLLPSQNAIRSFIFSIHPRSGDLDDIMQNTTIMLWEKFETFDRSRDFLPWAKRLAYFEVLKHRKRCSRDRLVFSEDFVDYLACDDGPSIPGEALMRALEGCVSRLDSGVRSVVEARYASGLSIADLARKSGQSVHRLYRQLEKARELLVSCVRHRMGNEDSRLPS
jgi:RNA polymerase sigma-70 factor (ECF subfamily)